MGPAPEAGAPTQWTGTLQGADPGFVSIADNDVRLKAGSPLIDAGPSAPAGPTGFDFPSPAFPPVFSPPFRTLAAAPQARPTDGSLDIGAYEAGTIIGVLPEIGRTGSGGRSMVWFGRGAPAFGGKPARYLPNGRRAGLIGGE